MNSRHAAVMLLAGTMLASAACGGVAGTTYQASRELADAVGCTDFNQHDAGAGDSGSCTTWGGIVHPAGSLISIAVETEERDDLARWRQAQVDFARTMVIDPGDCEVLLIGENWRISVGQCGLISHGSLLATAEALKKVVGGTVFDITP